MRIFAGIVMAALVLTARTPFAQQEPLHLNPVIAKLAEGKTVYGLNTGDLSLVNARDTARAPVDFVYVDMEHNPLDFPALHLFLMGMSDRGMVLKKGNLQPNVALFARFPPEADQSQWVVKQALDIGLHGVIFNGVDRKEQAMVAIRSMRYPQLKGSKYYEPNGIRGAAPGNATWIWGISGDEYERHAEGDPGLGSSERARHSHAPDGGPRVRHLEREASERQRQGDEPSAVEPPRREVRDGGRRHGTSVTSP
jgi:4-hydroxy-2-oxoheptanedioate aldolase